MRRIVMGVAAAGLLVAAACGDDGETAESTSATGSGASSSTSTATTSGSGGDGTGVGGAGGSGGGTGGEAPDACTGTEADDPDFAEAMDRLRADIAAEGATGGAIAIIRGGAVQHIGVAGSKTSTACDPVTEDTLFQLGFSTQLVTSIAALDAIEDGELDLGTRVRGLIPDLAVETGDLDAIEVRHLLSYASMFRSPSDRLDGLMNNGPSVCDDLDTVFASEAGQSVQAAPGSLHDIEDISNMELLGLALQKVDGAPFPDVARARVLDPLGIGGAFLAADVEASDHALGHYRPSPLDVPPRADCRNRDPSIGYFGSIRDVARIVDYVSGGEGGVLDADSRASMLETHGVHFASDTTRTFGLNRTPLSDREEDVVLWSDTQIAGFTEAILIYPGRDLAVVTLLNVSKTFAWTTALAIAQIFEPDLPGFPSVANEPDSLPSLVGTYVDDVGFEGSGRRTLEVVLDDEGELTGRLDAVEGDAVDITFGPTGSVDNFVMQGGGTVTCRFWRDDDGGGAIVQIQGDYGPPFYRVVE